jgi:hypothetical protein
MAMPLGLPRPDRVALSRRDHLWVAAATRERAPPDGAVIAVVPIHVLRVEREGVRQRLVHRDRDDLPAAAPAVARATAASARAIDCGVGAARAGRASTGREKKHGERDEKAQRLSHERTSPQALAPVKRALRRATGESISIAT